MGGAAAKKAAFVALRKESVDRNFAAAALQPGR